VKGSLILTLGYMSFLLLLSSIPVIPGTQRAWNLMAPFVPANQDFLHLPAYFLLALLWAKTLKDNGTKTCLSLVAAVVITSAYGAITELSQVWVPGRCVSLLDWLFDISGALAATGLFWIGQFEKRLPNAEIIATLHALRSPGRDLAIQGPMGLTAGSRSCQRVLDSRSETTAGRGPRQSKDSGPCIAAPTNSCPGPIDVSWPGRAEGR
jgi:VanZ family protein